MKLNYELKKVTSKKDNKNYEFDTFYVSLDLGSKIGHYQLPVQIELPQERQYIKAFIDTAEFNLVERTTKEGVEYVAPVVNVLVNGVPFEFRPKISFEALILLRYYLGF